MSEQYKGHFNFTFIFTVFCFAFILYLVYNKNIFMDYEAFYLFYFIENGFMNYTSHFYNINYKLNSYI